MAVRMRMEGAAVLAPGARLAHLAGDGIAATQAAGLVEVLGSMARVLNAGFAARNGLARLARVSADAELTALAQTDESPVI